MKYQYHGLLLKDAIAVCIEQMEPIYREQMETIPLLFCLNRVTAQSYYALNPNPPFARSAMDGYAVRSEDLTSVITEKPLSLQVIDEVYAGDDTKKEIRAMQAVRIMTGAKIPAGADAVVRQEDTDHGEKFVSIFRPVKPAENICAAGEEFQTGDCLVQKETILTPVEIGILASAGYDEVLVHRRPRIGIFVTGSELTFPGQKLAPGKIYDSNQFFLYTRLQELGFEPVLVRQLQDDPITAAKIIEAAANELDLIITTGGVSVGKKDIMHETLERMDAVGIFWKIKMKPGAPTIFAVYKNVPIIALSGNPFGAYANMELLVRPILQTVWGDGQRRTAGIQGIMDNDYPKSAKCHRYIRGIYKDGTIRIPDGLQTSGVLRTMAGCNCLIEIPPGQFLKKGEQAEVVLI